MKICRTAVVGGVLMAALLPVNAMAAACPAGPEPELRVIGQMPTPDYHHDLTRPQIGARAGAGHMTSDRRHLGLTHIDGRFTVRPTVGFRRMADGTICASVKAVEFKWWIADFRVDVAAEYRGGSCAYDNILRHENAHVAIWQRAYSGADRDVRPALSEALRRERAFAVHSTQQQAADMAAKRLNQTAKDVFDRYLAQARRENAALDTPENYRAEQRRCKDW